ncbi:MAG: SNF2-related protein, partial [Vitreimonas sp.]
LKGGRLAFDNMQAEMSRILLPTYTPPKNLGLRDGQAVRAYQGQAVELLYRSKGLLLCDDVGLGKSFVAAAASLTADALPAIFVCSTHLQRQWCDVIARFTRLWPHPLKKTRPYDLPRADIYVMRYTQLVGWIDYLVEMETGLIVLDEIQHVRHGTETQKGIAAKRLTDKARMRLGLSATPIFNRGPEIYEIMCYIAPQVLGKRDDFLREWVTGGALNDGEALGTYLRESFVMLRRTKRDVGQEMPPVNRVVKYVEYDEDAVKSIEELAHQLAVTATTGSFHERGQATRELDMRVRQQTGAAKAKGVAAFVRILVEGGTPVMLGGWHREFWDIVGEELKDLNPVFYTGTESTSQKQKSVDDFLSGKTDLFFISLRSGEGLDGLQKRCSTVVIGELDWSPAVHHQLIGRCDREGQTDYPVNAIFLVVDDGSDPVLMEINGLKAADAHAILDPGVELIPAQADESQLKKLVQRYLQKRSNRR